MNATVVPSRDVDVPGDTSPKRQILLKLCLQKIKTEENTLKQLKLTKARLDEILAEHYRALDSDEASLDLMAEVDEDLAAFNDTKRQLETAERVLEALYQERDMLRTNISHHANSLFVELVNTRTAPTA